MKYKLLVPILLLLFISQAPAVLGSPITSIDETVTENTFYSKEYTNPDSVEAHQIVVYSEDGEHSQIHLHYKLTPRITTSPDGNYSCIFRWLEGHKEDYFILNNITMQHTHIENVATMGFYGVAFSPDSKMYAAPRLIYSDDCRNGQYAIDICSVHNNTLLHRELTPFYIESTTETPMEWEKSAMYEVYWSDDGSSIVYEVLGGNTEAGQYPAYLVSKRLNLDYAELRKMNGYEDIEVESVQEETEDTNTEAENSLPIPGFEALGAVFAMVLGRKIKRA
ncbi:hypothetical protein [uncultured Methanolobus sp.]|uniref:hypothetical protein n=1 Tax=uncultured Methanolobus sp. TaxID=218300 RepID=UPI002AABAD82|nr:hypothetical protein [uncultured Methanolobus sp.]